MDGMPGMAFHVRLQRSVLAGAERRALIWMARRLPLSVTPDHLSELALAAMFATGASFAALRLTRWAALGVVAGLAVNWFGDSLDGTLARVRQRQRPRYGFYVDHLVDGVGALFLVAGLAVSGLTSPGPAWAALLAYLILQLHIVLKAHATGVFQIAFGGVGGTELRLLLVALNTSLLAGPTLLEVFRGGLFDAVLVMGTAALTGTLLVDAIHTARSLDLAERGPTAPLTPGRA